MNHTHWSSIFYVPGTGAVPDTLRVIQLAASKMDTDPARRGLTVRGSNYKGN